MESSKYFREIERIIESDCFYKKLSSTLQNYPNQKLENHIRNILVESFNDKNKPNSRAFAEHPRYTDKETKKRISVDFSICKGETVDFTMELKYNFPNDNNQFKNYKGVISKDFITRTYYPEKRKIDAFLLIVCETNLSKQKEFEQDWKLNSLSQYQIKNPKKDWKMNLNKVFKEIKNELNCEFKILKQQKIITSDLIANFYFYTLYRK
jgi:hypothetical protein